LSAMLPTHKFEFGLWEFSIGFVTRAGVCFS
jgi:hypothetical protein